MNTYPFYILFIIASFSFSCPSSSSEPDDSNESNTTTTSLQPLPQEIFSDMISRVNKGEITFYGDIPFSLSIDQAGCISYFQSIANMPVPDLTCAKAQGRIFFVQDTESVIDAEFYLSDDCAYFMFYSRDQKFANLMQGQLPEVLRSMMDPSTRPTRPN